MRHESMYEVLRDIVRDLSRTDPYFKELPPEIKRTSLVVDLGLDLVTLPEVLQELRVRLEGRDIGDCEGLLADGINSLTLGELLAALSGKTKMPAIRKEIAYVDDEEENLFIFKRKFGNRLNLKTFTDPRAALEYIRATPEVGLVITDEVMPGLGGNQLCDEVHKTKPFMKFILITGNPNGDDDLMYNSLRRGRFYEFINKPLDLEGKGEEYLAMIQGLLNFDW